MKAPEFTLKNQEGKEVSLSDYRVRKTAMRFRPFSDCWLIRAI
ncbi:peroxiredoxin family protein, partial [[Clostridium] symbiosum]